MYESKYYETLKNNIVKCLICPHECEITDGSTGICNSRYNDSGKLYSINYGLATALNIDPIEKKPLNNFHPGSWILSLGSFGCNFKCGFCQNYHISQTNNKSTPDTINITPDDVVNKALKNKNNIGIAYTYNEPAVWFEYMLDTAKMIRENNLLNVVVSNGYINPQPLEELLTVTDAFNIDLKAFDNEFYKNYTSAGIEPILNNLKTISNKKIHLEITNLIIPGLNDNKNIFRKMVSWISDELGPETPLHINRYFPVYKFSIPQTPVNTLLELKSIAEEKLRFVYCGNI